MNVLRLVLLQFIVVWNNSSHLSLSMSKLANCQLAQIFDLFIRPVISAPPQTKPFMPKFSANFQASTFWRTQALFDFHCFSGLWHLLIFLCFISYSGSGIFVLSNLFFVLDSTGSIFNRYLLCFTFLLQLEADEALNLVGSEHNNVDFMVYLDVRRIYQCRLYSAQHLNKIIDTSLIQFDLHFPRCRLEKRFLQFIQ